MRISNKAFDIIKWFSLAFIPSFEVLILTIGKIWHLPYYTEIGATIAAVGVFLAAIIRVSSNTYYEELTEPTTEDMELLFTEEDEEGEIDDHIVG